MEAFKKKTDVFGSRLVGWRLQREQLATELESGVLFEDLQDAREEVVTAYTQLTALIHDELAGL
jgi:hypothetical protein